MVPTVVPLALYLGAPPALETPKALAVERLPASCSIGSRSRAPGGFKALLYPKEHRWLLGAPRALVTDEKFWDHETYIYMTHLRALGPLCTLGAPASFRSPKASVDSDFKVPLVLGSQLASGAQLSPKGPVTLALAASLVLRAQPALRLGPHLAPGSPWSSNGLVCS